MYQSRLGCVLCVNVAPQASSGATLMKALGKPVKVSWFYGGHYSLRADLNRLMGLQEELLDFAQAIIIKKR